MKTCTLISALMLVFVTGISLPAEEILYDRPERWQTNSNVQFQFLPNGDRPVTPAGRDQDYRFVFMIEKSRGRFAM